MASPESVTAMTTVSSETVSVTWKVPAASPLAVCIRALVPSSVTIRAASSEWGWPSSVARVQLRTGRSSRGSPWKVRRVFYELYRDKGAFEEHESKDYARAFLSERDQYLSVTEVDRLDLVSGKGVDVEH